MAGSTTFIKRQKERARQERAAEKAARKAQRKQEQQETPVKPAGGGNPTITYDEDGQPQGLNFHDF